MSLHLRQRGEYWHARGTVRVGTEVITVGGFSTGATSRRDAEAIASREEARIRREHQEGAVGRGKRLTVDHCLEAYFSRPGGLPIGDQRRVREMSEFMGTLPIREAGAGWSDWLDRRGVDLAPATAQRTRTALLAALRYGCKKLDAGQPPELAPVSVKPDESLPYLTDAERERLLASYNPAAARPVLVLAYQGLRTQECLRLDWRHVDLRGGTLRIEGSKKGRGGRGRTVPMHDRIRAMLAEMHAARQVGPVFLSTRGEPWADTRGRLPGEQQGGNPLRQAHATACRRAGVSSFTVHDWRHDWATRMVRAGVPVVVLKTLGGWSSMRMLERYVTIEGGQMREAVARLA